MARENIKYSKLVMLAIALGVAFIVFICYESGVFAKAELFTLDWRFYINSVTPRFSEQFNLVQKNEEGEYFVGRKSEPNKSDPNIAFIDVPASGSDIRTCLPADICADLVKILSVSGARSIMIDSVLTDPLSDPGYASLGEMIRSSRGVYLPILYDLNKDDAELFYSGDGVNGVVEPKPSLYSENTKLGYINAFPDADKMLRRVPAVIRHKGKENYFIGLEMAFDALGISRAKIKFDPENHIIDITMPSGLKSSIPLEKDNQLLINWGSCEKAPIPHYSHRDIIESFGLEGSGLRPIVDLKTFAGKICIIGTAESNKVSGMPVKIENNYATSGACAMAVNSALKTSFIRHIPGGYNIALIFLISVIAVNSLVSRNFMRVMMVAVLSAGSLAALYVYGISSAMNLIIAIGLSIVLGVALASFSLFSGFVFTALSSLSYALVSVGLFKLFNIDIVTFYPVLSIVLIFVSFYIYTRLLVHLSSVQLFNMAAKDGLTGMFNRRHLNVILDAEIESINKNKGGRLSIVMCDIDNFKKLNDTHGHQAGDAILKEFARILSSKCRKSDIVARYGGEEFMVVLAGAAAADAYKVAESMRQAIEAKAFMFKGQDYRTTMSMGLTEATNEKTKEELIEKADQALYKAKKEGKNRVVIFK